MIFDFPIYSQTLQPPVEVVRFDHLHFIVWSLNAYTYFGGTWAGSIDEASKTHRQAESTATRGCMMYITKSLSNNLWRKHGLEKYSALFFAYCQQMFVLCLCLKVFFRISLIPGQLSANDLSRQIAAIEKERRWSQRYSRPIGNRIPDSLEEQQAAIPGVVFFADLHGGFVQ